MIKNVNLPLFNYNDKLITKLDILQFIKENIYNENNDLIKKFKKKLMKNFQDNKIDVVLEG